MNDKTYRQPCGKERQQSGCDRSWRIESSHLAENEERYLPDRVAHQATFLFGQGCGQSGGDLLLNSR